MHPPGAGTVLVRYGEIGIKSNRVQSRQETRLRENIEAKLTAEGLDAWVEREHTRLYVHTTEEEIEAATAAVADIFGVVSASAAVRVDPTMDAIQDTFGDAAARHYDGGTFAVHARRAGADDDHPFSSTDLERDGGGAVWKAAEREGLEPAVDLEEPDHEFFVECRPEDAYVFLEKRSGPGGLPLGCQEPVVALVSGGIDSPVAAWEMMKRGCPVYPLYLDLGAFGGVDHRLRAIETVTQLQQYAPQQDLEVRVAPASDAVDRIVDTAENCRMLVWRRFMFRVAAHLANSLDAVGIVTGESIGQKSSQTSANLGATSAVTSLPVHRPLLAMDKTEISQQAREIGTYPESNIDAGCNRIAPQNPATGPKLSVLREREPEDIERLARETAAQIEIVEQ